MALLMPPGYAASTPVPPVGATAKSPGSNLPPPTNTLPANQTAQIQQANAAYVAANPNVFGTPTSTQTPSGSSSGASTGLLPSLANNQPGTGTGTPTVSTTPTTQTTSTPANNGANYTPPLNGTAGVSTGGTVGNLVGLSQTQNPNYTTALNALNNLSAQSTAIGTQGATAQNNINSEPNFLSASQGESGILQQLIAQKQAALSPQIQAAQTELGAANTQSSQQTSAASAAASATAPTTNPQTQGLVNPTNPTTTGSTTSGANLGSLIGTRPSASSPGTTEYYNTQTGQGFATPQALADFVNQQMPGSNANAQNVFGLLQAQQSGQAVPPSNPYYQTLQTFAQAMANNQMAAVPYNSLPSAIQSQLLQMTQAINPSFNINTAQGAAAAQTSNTQVAGTAAVNAANSAYGTSYATTQQLNNNLNNISTLGNMTVHNAQGGSINLFSPQFANATVNSIKGELSSSDLTTFNSNLASFQAAAESLYASSGGATPTVISNAIQGITNGTLSISALQAAVAAAEQEAQGRLTNAGNTTGSEYNQATGNTSSYTNGQTAAGGALVYQNGQWIAAQ